MWLQGGWTGCALQNVRKFSGKAGGFCLLKRRKILISDWGILCSAHHRQEKIEPTWQLNVDFIRPSPGLRALKRVYCACSNEALALQKDREKSPEDRLMLTPCVKPIVEELEGGEGRQQCLFNLRYELDVLWEGADKLSQIEPA